MKTPAVTAMVGAQTTINNQLKAVKATATETATMTATTMSMETKVMVAVEARRQREGGSHWRQLGKSMALAVVAARRQCRQWQRGGGSVAATAAASLAAKVAA